jgi:hemoglobin
MKKDIETRTDIELLVKNFYEKITSDPLIGFIFDSTKNMDWEAHLPLMYDFWENVLFFTGGYNGNPLALHKAIHLQIPLKKEYFEQWIRIFNGTVDELFTGANASTVKKRASNISTIMQIKILHEDEFPNSN